MSDYRGKIIRATAFVPDNHKTTLFGRADALLQKFAKDGEMTVDEEHAMFVLPDDEVDKDAIQYIHRACELMVPNYLGGRGDYDDAVMYIPKERCLNEDKQTTFPLHYLQHVLAEFKLHIKNNVRTDRATGRHYIQQTREMGYISALDLAVCDLDPDEEKLKATKDKVHLDTEWEIPDLKRPGKTKMVDYDTFAEWFTQQPDKDKPKTPYEMGLRKVFLSDERLAAISPILGLGHKTGKLMN